MPPFLSFYLYLNYTNVLEGEIIMKKLILAALTAFVLCSYSFAQDNNYTPVSKNTAKESSGENRSLGIGLNLTGLLLMMQGADLAGVSLTIRPTNNILWSLIFGFIHRGETTTKTDGYETKGGSAKTIFSIGTALDLILVKKTVPFSLGGEFVYNNLDDDVSRIDFGIMAGLHGEIAPNVILSGKFGPAFMNNFSESKYSKSSRLDFAMAYRIYVTWFAL